MTAQGLPGVTNPTTGWPVTSVDIYQTLFGNGTIGHRSISRADIAQFGLNPGPNSVGRVIFGIVPDFVNPYAHQASFEIEHAFGDYALSIGYEFNRGLHEIRSLDRRSSPKSPRPYGRYALQTGEQKHRPPLASV